LILLSRMDINIKSIKINKDKIDEISLRNCLYWVDENITWELLEGDLKWEVLLSGSVDLVEKETKLFNININDNILRFNLSRGSHSTREQIIKNALLKLAKND
jgi:hypothetical protein